RRHRKRVDHGRARDEQGGDVGSGGYDGVGNGKRTPDVPEPERVVAVHHPPAGQKSLQSDDESPNRLEKTEFANEIQPTSGPSLGGPPEERSAMDERAGGRCEPGNRSPGVTTCSRGVAKKGPDTSSTSVRGEN